MARFEFTMVSDAMMHGLSEAGATGGEILAYIMLVRGLPKDRSTAECWMPADMAEEKGIMSAHTFSKMLRSLASKTVTLAGGQKATVLTKVTRGCKGHCPHYEDTLGLLIARDEYPPSAGPTDTSNGDPTGHPTDTSNGDPKQDPLDEFSTIQWGPKTNQLGTQNEPIGDPTGHPIETRQDRQLVADAPLPTAERSVSVSQPDKQDPESSRVDTGTEPARADGAAPRGRATALPSWAELTGRVATPAAEPPTKADERRYFELLRKVEDHMALGGSHDEALTPQERDEFNEISARRRAHTLA